MPFEWLFTVFCSTAMSGSRGLRCGLSAVVVVVVVGYVEQHTCVLCHKVSPARRLPVASLASSSAAMLRGTLGSMQSQPNPKVVNKAI